MPDYREMYLKVARIAEGTVTALEIYGRLVEDEAQKLRKALREAEEIGMGDDAPVK